MRRCLPLDLVETPSQGVDPCFLYHILSLLSILKREFIAYGTAFFKGFDRASYPFSASHHASHRLGGSRLCEVKRESLERVR
jgi:hypothetical protein